eukprot:TRINITY_DN47455_c0_g1_i1.p1 TRINITY_DN47455_c0_g1~~TRINITY_DN47455_c0_g1_i1.p1  ORF type:complete len:322 (-),score=45.09 TRINITY_DN47455_c0_g1_i1:43-1008(-)
MSDYIWIRKVLSMIDNGIEGDEFGVSYVMWSMRTDIETLQRAIRHYQTEPEPEGVSRFLRQSNTGESIAHAAAFHTDGPEFLIEVFRVLEDNVIKLMIRLQNSTSDTSLFIAVKLRKIKLIAFLKEQGTDDDDFSLLTITNNSQMNVLHFVADHGLIKIAKVLLHEVPYEIRTVPDEYLGWSPLHYAAKNGNISMMEALLEGLTLDQKSQMIGERTHDKNETSLLFAFESGSIEATRFLLNESRPEIREIQNNMRLTVLNLAVEAHDIEMTKMLLEGSRPELWTITSNPKKNILDMVDDKHPKADEMLLLLQIHIDDNPVE